MKPAILLSLLLAAFSCLPAQSTGESVDFDKARQLFEKRQKGGSLTADVPETGAPKGGSVTLVVRPENATLVAPGKGDISGVVENVVYFGTDTHIHLKLADGSAFIVRQQNASLAGEEHKPGEKAGIAIAAGTPRMLKD